MGFFSKLFKDPEVDEAKSSDNQTENARPV